MKDLLGGGASREEMLVWVSEVQIPKVEYVDIKQPLRYLNLLILLIIIIFILHHMFPIALIHILSLYPSNISVAPPHGL